MQKLDFINPFHNKTKRNYLQRVVEFDKAECAEVAIQYGQEYWDGDRRYGFGGYNYDGRWQPLIHKLIQHYNLPSNAKILDVGCGKGFHLYEFSKILPKAEVRGIDISSYAIENSKKEIRDCLQIANANQIPFSDNYFDFVFSITTLHNLLNFDLKKSLQEIERVGRNKKKYIVVESYRTEKEKANLLYWQLTCRTFYKPEEWVWFFMESGYLGDYEFIFFE